MCGKYFYNYNAVSLIDFNGMSTLTWLSYAKCCIIWCLSQLWYKLIYNCKTLANSVVQVRTFYKLLTSAQSDTRRETQFLLCWPYYVDPTNARRILWCLRSLSVEIRKTQLHLQRPKSNSQLSFKILRFSGPSLQGMTSSALQPHYLSGVYYDNGNYHIFCVLNDYAPELLTWIVQSPTKLNNI